eukprot:gene1113-15452_t
MAEKLSGVASAATAYYAVAVVKAGSGLDINNLKGKKSCHTGVQKTSGWLIPVGALLSKKIMSWVSCNQYASVSNYFSQSCAPGANDKKYNPDLTGKDKLCALCSGSGADKCSRSSKEPYYSYDGAFKCLKDGGGDVAFIKASIVTSLSTSEQAKYKLLCLDGTVKDPKDFASCNLARVSSHAVLARVDAPIASYQSLLKEIDTKLQEKTGSSLKYDGTLFSKNTIGLEVVATANQSYDKYLDQKYINDISALDHCAKWCVTSKDALDQCNKIKTGTPGNPIYCLQGSSEKDCYTKIAAKQADIGMFDGGSIYHAGMEHNLSVIVSEQLNTSSESETAYYAIAVVNANSKLTIKTLKGKKSCHTGVKKTSGWIVPVGHLLSNNMMSMPADCDEYGAVSNYFSLSCAPGANDPKYNSMKTGAEKLCSLCAGTGSNKCARNENEPYYGYGGAFKCLKDGKGEVAFIKQGIIPSADEAQYRLLCTNGTTKEPKDYITCNLARVPSHAVLARPDAPIKQYQTIIQQAKTALGSDMYSPPGKLFSKDTNDLVNVPSSKRTYSSYLDKAYMKDIVQVDSCVKSHAFAPRFSSLSQC